MPPTKATKVTIAQKARGPLEPTNGDAKMIAAPKIKEPIISTTPRRNFKNPIAYLHALLCSFYTRFTIDSNYLSMLTLAKKLGRLAWTGTMNSRLQTSSLTLLET